MLDQFNLQYISTNGITLRAAVEGDGPLVIMVHGWPENWYSWRHQIKPIAKAGFKVCAIDVRGYGGSDKPHPIEAYDMQTIMADIIGVIDFFKSEKAILIGHDWGAGIVWNVAALLPERVAAVAGLSVPYIKRAPVSRIELWNQIYTNQGKFFYQVYFQDEGIVEAEVEADMRTALRKIYFSLSGSAPSLDKVWTNRPAGGGLLDRMIDPKNFPQWMTQVDLDYFVQNFESGGFRGPINRYRNQHRDFQMLPNMGLKMVNQPSVFIGGSKDLVRVYMPGRDNFQEVDEMCTDLRACVIIDHMGHWIQQEAPDAVNATLINFLDTL